MTDGEHTDSLRRWLVDDLFVLNTVFLVAASSLALALTSCLWHHIHPEPSVDQQLPDNPPSIFFTLSPFRISIARTALPTSQQALTVPSSSLAPEQKDHKSTRSKERRRRGKDPFRDLLKSGKKSKSLLKVVKPTDHNHSPSLVDTLSAPSAPGNDTASSTSRSQSPEPAWILSGLDHCAPRLDPEPDDVGAVDTMITSFGDISVHHPSDACSPVDTIHAIRPHSIPPDSTTSTQASHSASTAMGHASEDVPSSPIISTPRTDICTPPPCSSQAASTSGNRPKVVCPRTRLRLSKIEPSIKSPSLSSTHSALPDNVESISIHPGVPCLSLSIDPSSNHSVGAVPSMPTESRGSTPPSRSSSPFEDLGQRERNTQPLDQSAPSAQIQLASMHNALGAARLREEKLRAEAEQASKERDEFRWRWNEDIGLWKIREADLQAQIHNLMQQLHAYAAIASFQAQQTSNPGFCPPMSPHAHSSPHLQHHPLMTFPLPPVIQTQNSASAPAHVQALLASAPMLTSHPPGFVAPPSAGSYPGKDHSMSPLLWSGLGLCVPKQEPRHRGRRTPDSSTSGSSSRGRHRQRRAENVQSASDESSLGEWDGIGDGSEDEDLEEEEDVFRNNALADAILKRPESIRGLGGSIGKRSGMGQLSSGGRPPVHGMAEVERGGVEERMDALKDPAEKHGFVPPLLDTPAIRTAADMVDRQ